MPTGISYLTEVWQPVTGCSPCSPGCHNCYAAKQAGSPRLRNHRRYKGLVEGVRSPPNRTVDKWTGEVRCNEEDLTQPLRWKQPRVVGTVFMGDLFHPDVSDAFLDKVFAVMALCSRHTFVLCTKRAERMREYLTQEQTPFRISKQSDRIRVAMEAERYSYELRMWPKDEHYFVSNTGDVFTTHGSARCVWCGKHFTHGQQDSRFCGVKCKSASSYARRASKNAEPAGAIMRSVPNDTSSEGYRRVWIIGGDRELVHQMVLQTFDRSPVDGEECCHFDGDPSNCHIANLRWGSHSDNLGDCVRHGTYRRYCKLTNTEVSEIRAAHNIGASYADLGRRYDISATQAANIVKGKQWNTVPPLTWPLPSVHLGVTVESWRFSDRIDSLRCTPAAHRWLSLEPLLAKPPSVGRWSEWIGSVILGCESGPNRRPFDLDWARQVRDDCDAAGVKLYVKQLSIDGKVVTNPEKFPVDLRSRELPWQLK